MTTESGKVTAGLRSLLGRLVAYKVDWIHQRPIGRPARPGGRISVTVMADLRDALAPTTPEETA